MNTFATSAFECRIAFYLPIYYCFFIKSSSLAAVRTEMLRARKLYEDNSFTTLDVTNTGVEVYSQTPFVFLQRCVRLHVCILIDPWTGNGSQDLGDS